MKNYSPSTPSRRHMSVVDYRQVLSASQPEKSLTRGGKRAVGRNHHGRITTRHKGGGHKRVYRLIDFKYDKQDIPAKVETVEYDPNRSGFIALVLYADGERRYVLLPQSVKVGDSFIVSEQAPIKVGNRLPLKNIVVGTTIYNLEVKPKAGAKVIRSAGSLGEVLSNDAGFSLVKMPSGEIRKFNEKCWATIGSVSNEEYKLVKYGKAGRSRWKGIRPTVRGSAMNPVDHPYGGGEGRQGRGTKRPKTAWGKITGGTKTRRPKKYSNQLIVSRRKKRSRR